MEKQGKNRDFKKNFQISLLMALLERKMLTKEQFDICVDEVARINRCKE